MKTLNLKQSNFNIPKNEILENNYLRFIFPYFSYPKESRFIKTFSYEINKNQKNQKNQKRKANFNKGMEIIPKNILTNIDNRTSIIIKNIPQSLSQETIKKILYLPKKLDYIYIPMNENNRLLGFVFINVINPYYILEINYMLKSYKDKFPFKINKPCEICYSNLQGKDALNNAFGPSLEF